MWLLTSLVLAADPTYTVSFPDRAAHRVQVEATLPPGTQEVWMPVWTPGSYLVREYSRHVEDLTVTVDGVEQVPRKVAKNRWRWDAEGDVRIRYALYARAHNVRGNWVDTDLAVLNGASTFLLPEGHTGAVEVEVVRPKGWATVEGALVRGDGFVAPDVDALIDSPFVVGNPSVHSFQVDGVEHRLVDIPADERWDSTKAVQGVQRIAEAQRDFWGELPYDRYVVLNWLGQGRGGLEHTDSTLLLTRRENTDEGPYEAWLGLVAHEMFHAWNAKRLRPVELGPFDYENEVYTRELWIVEGFTAYYDDLLLVRAGLIDPTTYLERLSGNLASVARTPGRLKTSLADSSFDAWIGHYRPDENSANARVSYYGKGALVAWLLDARIRANTGGESSLDDAMRLAWTRYAEGPGYTRSGFEAVLSEVAGEDVGPLLREWVDGTSELPINGALETFGLRLEAPTEPADAWLGVELSSGRVEKLRSDGPALAAGVDVGDEVLAVDDVRVGHLPTVLENRRPGERVVLLVARRGRLREIPVVLAEEPRTPELVGVDKPTRKQVKQREGWWGR